MKRAAQRFPASADTAAGAGAGRRAARPRGEVAVYVYGIARRDGIAESAAPFVEGIVPGVPVEVMPAGDIAVIVSRAPGKAFASSATGTDAESVWATERALAHHRVLANLAMFATIAPVKVGTVLPDMDSVFALLARSGRNFVCMLDRVAGAQEWGVKLFADIEICRRAAAKAPALVGLEGELAGASPRKVLFLRQKMNDVRDQIVRRMLAKRVDIVHRFIAARAREAEPKSMTLDAAWNGLAPALMLDAAYLVDRRREGEFQPIMADLAAVLEAEGYSLKLTGPWPPYSFAAIGNEGAKAELEQW